MRKLAVAVSLAALVSIGTVASTGSLAAIGGSVDAAIDAAVRIEKAGCFRLGWSGYHWYRYCAGPYWLYPHQRVCRRGFCWYR